MTRPTNEPDRDAPRKSSEIDTRPAAASADFSAALANVTGPRGELLNKDAGSKDSLLLKVVTTLRDNVDLRNDMHRIRRWHAYYRGPKNRDANGFGHALNTLEITETLTARDSGGLITERQAEDLCTTALIHDLGEIRLGNATYGGKSKEHEQKEYQQFKDILRRDFTHLSDYERRKLRRLFREVAFGDKSSDLLAKYFNMVEVTGYTTFGYQMFEERPPEFQWEVLSWRILAYHLFRTETDGSPKDIPAYSQWSAGARSYWTQQIHHLDWMVEHFADTNQDLWLKQVYDRLDLPDRGKVRPIDFDRWPEVRGQILGEEPPLH